MTIFEYAKTLFPNTTDEYVEFLVWERTCFPLDCERAMEQLREIAEKPCARCGAK